MEALFHTLLGDKLHVYRREGTPFWQCSTFLAGRNHRTTTKERDLDHAKKIAEEWYLSLQLKHRSGELKGGKSFADAAAKFFPEYLALTAGQRNAEYVKSHDDRLRVHLLPFFGNMPVSEIMPQTVQDYRVHRMTKPQAVKEREEREAEEARKAEQEGRKFKRSRAWMPPARSTLHHEIVTLRHVLKTAQRLGWIRFIPDLSPPYKSSGKVSHRAWFTLKEYNELCKLTRERAKNPPKARWKWECEQLNNFVVFMVNTGLRPDEAARLEFRDVEIVKDKATGQTILEITVRGKRGVGYCKSYPGAVYPFEQLSKRLRAANPQVRQSKGGSSAVQNGRRVKGKQEDGSELVLPGPTNLLFPALRHHHLDAVLKDGCMKTDREGLHRSAYSLRHTYICLRLMEGADIYQVAKNCRTSVEMIEKFYAAHIKNMIDTTAINLPNGRPNGRPQKRAANAKRASAASKRGNPRDRR